MKVQIRHGVFETNSSSTHSLTMCSKKEFEDWKNGLLLYDRWKNKFISVDILSEEDKKEAEASYDRTRTEFQKTWDELSDDLKTKVYNQFAREYKGLYDEDVQTYKEFFENDWLETYCDEYTTPSGEVVVAFGEFGYDG